MAAVIAVSGSERPVCRPETLLALVTDTRFALPGVPVFGLEDVGPLADLLVKEAAHD